MPPPPRPLTRKKSTSLKTPAPAGRISLAERAGTYKKPTVPPPGTISRVPSAAARARPSSSLEMGRPPSVTGAGFPRPPSAQSMTDDRDDEAGVGVNMPKRKDWDVKGKLMDHENALQEFREMYARDREEAKKANEKLEELIRKEYTWETNRREMDTTITQTKYELDLARKRIAELEKTLEEERAGRRKEHEEATRRLRDETDELRRRHRDELDKVRKTYSEESAMLERKLKMEIMDEKAARSREAAELKAQAAMERQRLEMQMDGSGREARTLKMELEARNGDLERERKAANELRDRIAEHNTQSLTMESTTRALKLRIEELENMGKNQLNSYAELEEQLRQANAKTHTVEEKLRNEEIIRRKLHNQVQELKGNIRVFCRVRPTLQHEHDSAAQINFPDHNMEGKEIEVIGTPEKSAMGNIVNKTHPFSFDKVFGPSQQNAEIFEEISQLVQSALDGYNVCIFCYGQTGSGKTYTMSSSDGMIPRAVHQIYATAQSLSDKGWSYTMSGNFVEVYNETINDLLGSPSDLDKKKHDIRHDPKTLTTTITDVETVILDTPDKVTTILNHAQKTRSVAATAANERSSRSHSVFILKLVGVNRHTGQRSEGTLNLVDLAGSERLSHSMATGERLKETQSINKSLSCLGDVIAALGSGKEGAHIPYRNSKLTYLLQYSLGGNSKCLMFVMVSPMMAHLAESLTSLKFATKVNNTSIGTAKKVIKMGRAQDD
ncbi:kinesin-domain-containing protein [Ascodesmis nigricans]|uniref:Kinesin-like protein n=1 Tax=Ascodesmis nigricans TaxID=341454 RepID=A0A4S2MQP8_9PEZI|nr:kinesin-domain-containing protein [Ascodesmis nigricans]